MMLSLRFKLLYAILIISFSGYSQTLNWASKLGSSTGDIAASVAVDAAGNVYNAGYFSGTIDLDPSSTNQMVTAVGGNDAFFLKFSPTGALIYGYTFGSTGAENSGDLVIDENDNVYVTFNFSGTIDFDPGTGVSSLTSNGSTDAAILKFDPSGNLLWVKSFGGTAADGARALALDTTGTVDHIIISGTYRSTVDFNPGAGSNPHTSVGLADGYILKLDEAGNYVWSYAFGGTSDEEPTGVGVDYLGNIYSGGNFSTTVDFDSGIGTNLLSSTGGRDIYFMKISNTAAFSWAFKIGTSGLDKSLDLVTDSAGNTYGTGFFSGTADFNPGTGTNNLVSAGGADIFVMKITPTGGYSWAKRIGSTGEDKANSIAFGPDGNIYPAGFFSGTVDFDPGTGTSNVSSVGNVDIFYCKMTTTGAYNWAYGTGSTAADKANGIWVGTDKMVHVTGYFQSTADFDPSTSTLNLTSAGSYDVFRLQLDPCIKTSATISASTCSSYTSPSGNYTWYPPGTFMDTIPNNEGCDSIITVNLSWADTYDTISLLSCYGVSSPSGNYFWTIPGTYTDTIPNAAGCDSILTVDVVNAVTYSAMNPTACTSYTSPSGNYTWTATGTYFDTIPNSLSCDSVLVINLTIGSNGSTISPAACNSYTSPSGNYTWTQSGTYYDTLTNVGGCDSILTINLTISGNSSSSTTSPISCGDYTSPSGNYIWTTSGTYYDTIPNTGGCDSTMTINLTIVNIDNTVTISGITLTAVEAGANYQWFDCDNGNSPVSGATSQVFVPSTSGNYGVYIDQNTCLDTSACVSVLNVSVQEINENEIRLYPNPVQQYLVIESEIKFNAVMVYDMKGQLVLQPTISNNQVDLGSLNTGVYLIELITEEGIIRKQVVKK